MIKFILSNFPLTFALLGLIVAGLEILRTPSPRPMGNSAENVLRWFMFFPDGQEVIPSLASLPSV